MGSIEQRSQHSDTIASRSNWLELIDESDPLMSLSAVSFKEASQADKCSIISLGFALGNIFAISETSNANVFSKYNKDKRDNITKFILIRSM